MGLLDRWFRRRNAGDGTSRPEPECVHASLVPHWDSSDAIGHSEQVSRYECESCHATLSRDEGERRLAGAAERLRVADVERKEP